MSHEESFEEESSDGSTKLTHSIFSGPTEDYTCALNNGVKALVGDWSGLLGFGAKAFLNETEGAIEQYSLYNLKRYESVRQNSPR